jgi:UDP-N-acetylglucosamine diphosphorylase / glucose-1-phosphate thymidylyltransferase / UDP-N-acetylgalactosamine diphosphorylase / glucosamine-1-phosphate N-acetyltransferase / galactosamine-1-phosphate N-acetyltransferase
MRLILLDLPSEKRINFSPLALCRPIWELRCGMTSLGEKLVAKIGAKDVACFVPPYMAEVHRGQTTWPVNDPAALAGDDLLLVSGRVKAGELNVTPAGPSQAAFAADGECLWARIARQDLAKLDASSIESLLAGARELPAASAADVPVWNYTWDLVLANPRQLVEDFKAAGQSGIHGVVEEPRALRGSTNDVYIGPGALVHPMVVLDAANGPIYIDEGAEIHPFTRIEGPCYIGKKTILLGAKCREGNSIGPMCRMGGEIEESIIQGYSNKYHDGFLGHAYVGQWVNLGAMTTNSDLKNDYSSVSVVLDGHTAIDTGSTKVGALIGDHTKTSIGTLLNTGAYVGAMALIATTGKLMPKFIPSFSWFLEGVVTKGFGKNKLYDTAKVAMSRRKCEWTAAEQAMWDEIFRLTAPGRQEAVKRGRRSLAGPSHS